MRMLLTAAAISFGLYCVLLLGAYLFQRSLLYFPDQQPLPDAYLAQSGFSSVEITRTEDGPLRSLWREPLDEQQPIILHFHGNAGSHLLRLPLYQMMAQEGAGVLGAGYPGYGGNAGSPSEAALFAAAQANYDWLRKRYPASRIVLVGQSLGSGVATWLATENPAAGLILEAAYSGMDDMAQRQFPILPAKYLVKDRYRSLDRIDAIAMPLIWIHGTADALIPFAMGQRLFDAAKQPKVAHPMKGGGHNDLWDRGIDRIIREEAVRLVNISDPGGQNVP